ncbi:MAG TPA: 4-amino-4-deoxychorismate lyase, partial [Acidimicrobiales bacterium]|nr:4-amino-4-deoxychorismate lyase [Acidimicrobiales bacterium]
YAENVVALAAAARSGADEALLLNNRGELCEGTGSNIFVVQGGRIRTPPLSSGCLAGITRELVGELVEVEEAPLTPVDLDRAEEVFITSSTRDVQPVASVDGRLYPGRSGPVTNRVVALFSDLLATRPDP